MWLLPTLNRIEKLKNFIAKAVEFGLSTPGLILVDDKDWEKNKNGYVGIELPEGWSYFKTEADGMADKIREAWPQTEGREWVGVLNDDHEPASDGWDKVLISKLNGKNFVSANDREPDGRAFALPVTATAFSMPLLQAVGWPIYPPGFQHLFIDNIWLHLGKSTGCWRMVPNAIVLHKHVLFGHAEPDETHKKIYDDFFQGKSKDQSLFEVFLKHDFQQAVNKIKALQDCSAQQMYNPAPKRGESNVTTKASNEPNSVS